MPPIDFETYWSASIETYATHPTSRHRRRFVLNAIRDVPIDEGTFVFDYGCGPALLLSDIKKRYELKPEQVGGCDPAQSAVDRANEAIPGGAFYSADYPVLNRLIDIAVTTEVIEHTKEYKEILQYLVANLRPGGTIVVTTPGGALDPPDAFYGHTQHFSVPQLRGILESLGIELQVARYWGFPLFTMQKWITKRNFDKIRHSFMEGQMTTGRRLVFKTAFLAYLIHDLIPVGPQIFIKGRKAHG